MIRQHPVRHTATAPELHAGHNLVVRALLVERVRYLVALDQLELDRQRKTTIESQMVNLQEDLAGFLTGSNSKSHQAVCVQYAIEIGGRAEFLLPQPVGFCGKGLVLRLGARLDARADLVADPVADTVADPAVVPGGIPRAGPHCAELADHGAGRTSGTRRPTLQA
ncbi:hypothetical protein D9M68_543560 [compost metagenome]